MEPELKGASEVTTPRRLGTEIQKSLVACSRSHISVWQNREPDTIPQPHPTAKSDVRLRWRGTCRTLALTIHSGV